MEITFLLIIVALILSIVIHEVAHGYMANLLGDPTARLSGRLTLNPIPHIDPVGSVLIPALLFLGSAGFLFGWAKPVPYNPYNLSNQKWGEALVAFAGPGVNILLALIFGVAMRLHEVLGLGAVFIEVAGYIVFINILLAFFNLIPIPPLDGSKVIEPFLPASLQQKYRELGMRIAQWGMMFSFLFIFVFIFFLWELFSALIFWIFELITGFSGI